MPKFRGVIGFIDTVETDPINRPGIFEETVVERVYKGDILENTRRWENSQFMTTNDDLNITSRFSIVADTYASVNFPKMKYVIWMGQKWKINSVTPTRPRLTLYIGGLYNGTDSD